jgi:hypothetical protein
MIRDRKRSGQLIRAPSDTSSTERIASGRPVVVDLMRQLVG